MNRWWDNDPTERFWLEITDRPDLGVDLRAPQTGDSGAPQWSYSLVTEAESGDVVFHYSKRSSAIVAWSVIDGDYWAEDIVWASHGTVAREAGVEPYRRPGWRRSLRGFSALPTPISLAQIRAAEPDLRTMVKELETTYGGSIYFPFALSELRPPRPTQGYLTKLPAAFVDLFDPMGKAAATAKHVDAIGESATVLHPDQPLGVDYRRADEGVAASERDAFSVDPSLVERGLRGHASTQNALAAHVEALGLAPRSPRPDEPNFDLAWTDGDTRYVAEVKSTTISNAEKQLRLGLGQVLRYRQLLSDHGTATVAVLAVEGPPPPGWTALCDSVGVRLVWPPDFQGLRSDR